jgi:outer membrane immunogenic protein
MDMLRAGTVALLATWGLAAAAVPAGADGPYRVPTYDATPGFYDFRWTGFYAGAHLGVAFTNVRATETDFAVDVEELNPSQAFTAGPLTQSYDDFATSVAGGVQVGWQKQWEKIVVGAELTYTALPFDETSASPVFPGVFRTAEVSNLVALTGRLGYADGRWLAYSKFGWAGAQVDITLNDTVTKTSASSSGFTSGWNFGVGIDYALTHNLFLGVEYNYLFFRADVEPLPIPDAHFSDDAKVHIQSLMVRLNYRFDGLGCFGAPPRC